MRRNIPRVKGCYAGQVSDDLLDDPRLTAVGLFYEAHTGLNARFAAQLCEHGLSPVEFEVLMRLARSPGHQLRMTDLACQTSLSTSGVTRVVDRMERDGFITRRACPSDRRSLHAVITQSGLAKLSEILPGHVALIEQWYTGLLPADQLATFLDALRTIRDAVNPGATAGATPAEHLVVEV